MWAGATGVSMHDLGMITATPFSVTGGLITRGCAAVFSRAADVATPLPDDRRLTG